MKPFLFILPLVATATSFAEPLSYECRRSEQAPVIDGDLSDPAWQKAAWTGDFMDIRGKDQPAPRFRTRTKMLWTAEGLCVCAELAEPHVWGTLTEKNAIIFHDNDFEIFLDPDGDTLNYYEFEINALGTIWELTLDKPYSRGGTATHGTNLPGLKSAVKVQGTLNNSSDTDSGWSVEVFLPWKDLAKYQGSKTAPPKAGDTWRINFSRVEWKHELKEGKYVRIPAHGAKIADGEHPEDNWVWSPQGEIAMHLPEHWGMLKFTE
ncbi:carbohydrate-binding family 9-like protein [Haloferula sp. BvORR071]|uniref:carbohydrate-binding family 9-like protein n=1 Tax=Haloferula sp. BvORR071 TaxID=1396141 RepID=UPI0009DF9656|nr:carbohydrate-binding family 9-like protein [Haloferula sp. BvORR071]